MKLQFPIVFIFALLLGGAATLFWVFESSFIGLLESSRLEALLVFSTLAIFTSANLAVRWLRWHYLTRCMDAGLTILDSVKVFFVTLPAILTPFYIGELTRGMLLARKYPHVRRMIVWIWLFERLLDVGVIVSLMLAAQGAWSIAAASWVGLAGLILLFYRAINKMLGDPQGQPSAYLRFGMWNLGLTAISWIIPVFALAIGAFLYGNSLGILEAADCFSKATLLGGISGIPGGSGVTGSMLIVSLQQYGMSEAPASTVGFLFRVGTVWYSVMLGMLLFWFWRHSILSLASGSESNQHFNAIASQYTDQIPEHIRDKLLDRKISMMLDVLSSRAIDGAARGLDLGCGQGWYACEMSRKGFQMIGVDSSSGQISHAQKNAENDGLLTCRFETMPASKLEFEDDSFDFIYSINVLHHIIDLPERERVFSEIIRVLKPGGVFLMHEMNTENPIFRIYLSYIFPLIKRIDEGNERWLNPTDLPHVSGAGWSDTIEYFTFLPDITPVVIERMLSGTEKRLEQSDYRGYSAHYMAALEKSNPAEPFGIEQSKENHERQ